MATIKVTDLTRWQALADIYAQIIQRSHYLNTLYQVELDAATYAHIDAQVVQDEIDRLTTDSKAIIDFLLDTPFLDSTLSKSDIEERKKLLRNKPAPSGDYQTLPLPPALEDIIDPTPEQKLQLGLYDLRQLYAQLLDLREEIVVPYAQPKPPFKLPPYLRRAIAVAAVLVLLVVFIVGIFDFLYWQGRTAFDDASYSTAIDRFNLTTTAVTYRDSDRRLNDSYQAEIDRLVEDDEYDAALNRTQDYFDTGLDQQTAIDLFNSVVLAQTSEQRAEIDIDEATSDEWVAIAAPIIALEERFSETIRPTLEPPLQAELDDALVDIFEESYVQRALFLDSEQDWVGIRALLAENALLFGWDRLPTLRLLYLDSLQDEVQVISSNDNPQWDRVEANVAELLDLINEDDVSEIQRYMPARIILAARYVDEAITQFNDVPPPTDTVDPTEWEVVRTTLDQAEDILTDDAIQAFTENIFESSPVPLYITIENYIAARNATTTELSATNSPDSRNRLTGDLIILVNAFIDSLKRDTYYQPAEAYYALEDYTSAQPLYAQIFTTAPDFRETRERYFNTFYIPATMFVEVEEYEDARILLGELISNGGLQFNDTSNLYRLSFYEPAQTALTNGDTLTGVEMLRTLYEIDPNYRDTPLLLMQGLFDLGEQAIDNGEFEVARVYLEEIRAIDPNFQGLLISLSDVYYVIATDTINDSDNANRFTEARTTLEEILEINVEYRDTHTLIRETYYQPIALSLDLMVIDPDAATCEAIRADIEAFIEIDERAINYKDTRLLLNETYYCQAQAFLAQAQNETDFVARQAAFEEVRVSIEALGLDSNYKDVNNLIIQTFYEPALTAYQTAFFDETVSEDDKMQALELTRDLLLRLRDNTELFYVFYDDAWLLLRNSYYIPAHRLYTLAEADFNAEGTSDETDSQWAAVREALSPLLSLDSNFTPPDDFTLSGDTTTISDLLGTEILLSISDLYSNTYYLPAISAYAAEDWSLARSLLASLREHDPLYADGSVLYRNTFYIPGQQAFNAENWVEAQDLLIPLVELDPTYRPTPTDPDAFTLLADSFAIPAERSYTEALNDHTSSRWDVVIDNLTQLNILDPTYLTIPPMTAAHFLRESYYQRALLAESAALAAEFASQEQVDAWQITRDSLVSLLLLDADPTVDMPNLLMDVSNPYRDAQSRLRDVFHQLAGAALTIGDWDLARQTALELIFIDPEDPLANEQLREAYYNAGQEALVATEYDEAQSQLTDLLLLDSATNPFLSEEPYLDADVLLLQAYHDEADAQLEAAQWADARETATELLALKPDDEVAATQLREGYYQQSLSLIENGLWSNARVQLFLLLRLDDPQQDLSQLLISQITYLDATQQYRRTYYLPATEALTAGNWSIARTEVAQLLNLLPNDSQANDIIIESYLRPAQQAFDTGNWGLTRDTLIDLVNDPTQNVNNLVNGDQYDTAIRLLVEAYLQPAQDALEAGDWGKARDEAANAIIIGTVLGDPVDTEAPDLTVVEDQLMQSGTVVSQSYFRQVEVALEESDWTTARDLLRDTRNFVDEFSTEYPLSITYFPSDAEIDDYLVRAYQQPVDEAIAIGDLATARNALAELEADLSDSRRTANELSVRLFSIALADALSAGDWFSAAELFVNLRNGSIDPYVLDQTLLNFPALQAELADRYAGFWQFADNGFTINERTIRLSNLPVTDLMAVAVNSSGTRAYIADGAGMIYAFNLRTSSVAFVIDTATPFATGITLDPDGLWLATRHNDEIVHIWDARSGQLLTQLQASTAPITALDASITGLVIGDTDGLISIWDEQNWTEPVHQFDAEITIADIDLNDEGTQLVLVGETTLILYDVIAQEITASIDAEQVLTGVNLQQDSTIAYGYSGDLLIYDQDGTLSQTMRGTNSRIYRVEYISEELIITLGSQQLILRDADAGGVLYHEDLADNAFDMALAADGSVLVTIGSENQISIWQRP